MAIINRWKLPGHTVNHVIAFARRHGRDAVITAVAKSFVPMSQGGRAWPRADAFDGALQPERLSVEGIFSEPAQRSAALGSVPASASRC